MLILPCDSSTADPPANSLVSLSLVVSSVSPLSPQRHKDHGWTPYGNRSTISRRPRRFAHADGSAQGSSSGRFGFAPFFQQPLDHLLLACARRPAKRRVGAIRVRGHLIG